MRRLNFVRTAAKRALRNYKLSDRPGLPNSEVDPAMVPHLLENAKAAWHAYGSRIKRELEIDLQSLFSLVEMMESAGVRDLERDH